MLSTKYRRLDRDRKPKSVPPEVEAVVGDKKRRGRKRNKSADKVSRLEAMAT